MKLQEFVREIAGVYNEEVRPFIEAGNYSLAQVAMSSLNEGLRTETRSILEGIHCGALLLSHAALLEIKLAEKDSAGIIFSKGWFEAYLAQTKLPTR